MHFLTLIAFLIGLAGSASAQTAPSPSEVAAYDGLFRAAHEGDVDGIEQLVAEGADVNARDSRGRTPAHVAAFASEDGALRALAEANADMNALEYRAYDVVTIAAVADDPELMSLAISLGNDPGLITSPYLGTALIAAAHLGHAEVVRRLIDAGAPLDHINNLHWTAVMEAVVLGDGGPDHEAVLDALLSAGADRTLADRDGVTPLEHAEARGFTAMAERLRRED
ncbi:ankyrin repeat domain-containing protein [Sulfitobacter sp. JBTF-M27]|uniref:Ankyrin repeat domain-containing protein n=1 Tax=Sulfitobacter sediminilitoris TaxID=2698830 RepID=A0A6P0CG30_9RHOB|nr:ankyrin repeat domain-containing protein [Sulfitobacter sediminilitoris]NEK25102.1 ankyrin repeat domain-containing protein [Sulfitobacter sediminilitoris]